MTGIKAHKIRKANSHGKKKGKFSRNQRLKDAESMHELDQSIQAQQMEIRAQINQPLKEAKKPDSESWEALKQLHELAASSAKDKKDFPCARGTESRGLLNNLLQGFDNINVSDESQKLKTNEPSMASQELKGQKAKSSPRGPKNNVLDVEV